jgi:NOL1/NOP2/fmu family ribosome biogenesis protein
MASITSGEMADCDWLRGTFSGPLLGFGKYNGNVVINNSIEDVVINNSIDPQRQR